MFKPFGKITVPVPGTPVQVNSSVLLCHAFMAEVLPANTGKTYIGLSNMNKTTLVGVIAILMPASSTVLPTFSATVAYTSNGIEMKEIFIDADNANEGLLLSAIVA